jgi:hypothetical protein
MRSPRRAASHSTCPVAIESIGRRVSGNRELPAQAERIGNNWFVVAQSLASANRIESDVLLLETIAVPILLVAVFFGRCLARTAHAAERHRG